MSENYRFYVAKMAERRAQLVSSQVLRAQLDELFFLVHRCEAMWALEDRIEKQR
jgi:hypothetical protein